MDIFGGPSICLPQSQAENVWKRKAPTSIRTCLPPSPANLLVQGFAASFPVLDEELQRDCVLVAGHLQMSVLVFLGTIKLVQTTWHTRFQPDDEEWDHQLPKLFFLLNVIAILQYYQNHLWSHLVLMFFGYFTW